MTCYEKILELLALVCEGNIEEVFILDDITLKRLNKLGAKQCEHLCTHLDLCVLPHDYEKEIYNFLNHAEKPKLDKMVKDLSIDNMWDRWERGGLVSKKELSLIISCSVDKIESYCRKSAGVYLKSYSSGTGANVYFKKYDWDEYEAHLER